MSGKPKGDSSRYAGPKAGNPDRRHRCSLFGSRPDQFGISGTGRRRGDVSGHDVELLDRDLCRVAGPQPRIALAAVQSGELQDAPVPTGRTGPPGAS